MKAIKYQGRLWIPANKAVSVTGEVIDVDKLQAELKIDKESRILAEQLLAEAQAEIDRLKDQLEESEQAFGTLAAGLWYTG